jgi:ribosomal 50S subunit-recycling heat shock protein
MQIKSKYKIARRLGPAVFEKTQTQKFAARMSRKGKKFEGRMASDFGKALLEKQKARYTYLILERQFKKYAEKAIAERVKKPEESLFESLETRFDNVVSRLALAPTRLASRQMVSHGHIAVNGMLAGLPVQGEKNIDAGTTLTLDASKVYLLKGFIVVRNGGKLVIPAGTIIRATSDLSSTPKNYASIIVERGGTIEINGTENNPVVITSAKSIGSRERGDWGGLLIAGRSTHNLWNAGTDAVQMEGFELFDAKNLQIDL